MRNRSHPVPSRAESQSPGGREPALVLGVVLALALAACSPKGPETEAETPHDVTLTAAQQQRIQLYTVTPSQYRSGFDASGSVDFDHDRSTVVLAPFSGPVVKLLVTLGEKVRKGQALATVASADFAAAAGAYRKAVAAAKAADQLAATDRDLFAHHALSQRENDQAQSDAVGADADRDTALQALAGLGVDARTIADIRDGKSVAYDTGVIRSPVAGTVIERSITPGQLLSAGDTQCFTVADLSRVWVMAQVFGPDLNSVHVGDSAEVDVGSGGKTLPGTVTSVSPEVDPATQSVLARVVVENPGDLLRRQMYVGVHIRSADSKTALLVPVSAILRDDENLPFVYVLAQDGGYARRSVDLGYRDGDRQVIESGVSAGDKVVVDGGIFLRFIETQ
ncbi:MAG TPA: efflux RND transporter periplasmic adaptor subunit [Gammaproteobacteria bacterium]|nr:efflux RND transporter periplasmic adaptor subunit [Gammaproteobacteria bacterium]